MSFEELLKKISPKLKGITYRLSGYSSFLGAEDLYQEAVAYLWDSFNRGLLTTKTDSYVLQGCYFYLKNYLRKNIKKASFVSLEAAIQDEEGGLERILSLSDFDKSRYLDDLNNKLLSEVIQNNGFTPKEKSVLSFFAQGLTTREIGRQMGVSHVRIVKMKQEIRQKCKRYIDSP